MFDRFLPFAKSYGVPDAILYQCQGVISGTFIQMSQPVKSKNRNSLEILNANSFLRRKYLKGRGYIILGPFPFFLLLICFMIKKSITRNCWKKSVFPIWV